MTPQEAIEIIDDVTWDDNGRHYGKIVPAREMAKKAIEKQIPKPPKYDNEAVNIYGAKKRVCQTCGDVCFVSPASIPYEHYCRFCGQKFHRSDEE